jgi:cold shock CspA family protein
MTTNGTIKHMTEKGFGFIATAEGTEYFFPSVTPVAQT